MIALPKKEELKYHMCPKEWNIKYGSAGKPKLYHHHSSDETRRMRWSVCGANNMAKLLYRRENDERIETIDRNTDGFVMTMVCSKN